MISSDTESSDSWSTSYIIGIQLKRLNFDSETLYLRKFMSFQTHSSTPFTLSSTTDLNKTNVFFPPVVKSIFKQLQGSK